MGQEEVIKLLGKSNKPLTSNEISQMLNIGRRSVRRCLNQLKKDNTIKLDFRRLNEKEMIKKYGKKTNSPNLMIYFLKK